MKAEGRYEIDPRGWANGSGANSTGSAIARHQAYVGLSGGFGAVKLGVMNAASLQAFLTATPLGTGIGTAFTGGGDHGAVSPVGVVRYNNSVRYDTPSMNGFGASLTYAPGNDDAVTGAVTSVTNFGLTYSNGPLNVAFSNLQTSATTNPAAVKTTFNFIGANYAIGAAKVFVGYGDGDKSGDLAGTVAGLGGSDVKQTRVGATYSMGAVTLLGQYTELEIGTAAKRKTTGLRADYALSKRTAAYFGYEAYDQGSAIATGLGNKRNTAAVGVRHSF